MADHQQIISTIIIYSKINNSAETSLNNKHIQSIPDFINTTKLHENISNTNYKPYDNGIKYLKFIQ